MIYTLLYPYHLVTNCACYLLYTHGGCSIGRRIRPTEDTSPYWYTGVRYRSTTLAQDRFITPGHHKHVTLTRLVRYMDPHCSCFLTFVPFFRWIFSSPSCEKHGSSDGRATVSHPTDPGLNLCSGSFENQLLRCTINLKCIHDNKYLWHVVSPWRRQVLFLISI